MPVSNLVTINLIAFESLDTIVKGLMNADKEKKYPAYSQVIEVIDHMRDIAGNHAFFKPMDSN